MLLRVQAMNILISYSWKYANILFWIICKRTRIAEEESVTQSGLCAIYGRQEPTPSERTHKHTPCETFPEKSPLSQSEEAASS
jgi:hypothetical protein